MDRKLAHMEETDTIKWELIRLKGCVKWSPSGVMLGPLHNIGFWYHVGGERLTNADRERDMGITMN